ncbi:rifin [Plasmodium reichenowi]|uniref:Rifin n=1 Tax=Plasmodium reichenowi TaxID=5854 RepID=A0A060RM14_PLARE|nr:rifin [Plasmodium reichenowi]
MKVHYINILLFALPLNILLYNQRNHKSTTPHHTAKIPISRLLCECELYAPANYDNDPQMKSVMENFNKQAQQRFHEYDDRMKNTRQKCKEQCDKNIQKIILKDKIEKELMDKFATLQTDIQSHAIPTCVCKKSMAEKVEKGCLRCTQNLGGIVAPSSGVLAGIAEAALSVWKPLALKAAARYAMKEGAAKGLAAGAEAGKNTIIGALQEYFFIDKLNGIPLESFFTTQNYANFPNLAQTIYAKYRTSCNLSSLSADPICQIYDTLGMRPVPGGSFVKEETVITRVVDVINRKATMSATHQAAKVRSATTAAIKTEKTDLINTICGTWDTAITASIIAIVVIVLIMVIIYLILRYSRKKKMKKKLQYIKLLEE